MNGVEQFISSLASSLSWPTASVAIAFAFRKPLGRILSNRPVKVLKAGPQGFEVEFFDEKLQEAKAELAEGEVPQIPGDSGSASTPTDSRARDFITEMQQLAEVAPSAVVMESFARLERVLRDAVGATEFPGRGGKPARFTSARELARRAEEQGIISGSELAAFDDVAVLRNVVAHGENADLDKDRVLEYADLVRKLIISISLESGRTMLDGPIA
jgi:hypothetical protein